MNIDSQATAVDQLQIPVTPDVDLESWHAHVFSHLMHPKFAIRKEMWVVTSISHHVPCLFDYITNAHQLYDQARNVEDDRYQPHGWLIAVLHKSWAGFPSHRWQMSAGLRPLHLPLESDDDPIH